MFSLIPAKRITPTRGSSKTYNKKTSSYYVPFVSDQSNTPNICHANPIWPMKIMTVGKLDLPRKNILLLLSSINLLSKKYAIELTIVGALDDGKQAHFKKIKDYIDKNKLNSICAIKSNVSYDEMHKLYEKHHLFVLPSVQEPFSISPLEAMGFGLPVIITKSNGAQGCVTNGINGFVIPANNVDALSEAIEFFLAQPDKISKFSQNALNYMQHEHTSEQFYSYFMKAIKDTQV
jgi:glycosyltransferase involved in cell wall biosynthesis